MMRVAFELREWVDRLLEGIMRSKNKSYWKDVFFQASGNTIAQAVGIIGMPVLTRIYAPDEFAVQAIFIQAVLFMTAFVTFRFEYFIQLTKDKYEANSMLLWLIRIGSIMVVVLTIAIIGLDLAGFFKYFNVHNPGYFYISPITAYLVCVALGFQHEAQRQGDFKRTALAEISSKVGYVSTGFVFSPLPYGMGLILTTMFGALCKIILLRSYFREFLNELSKMQLNKKLIRSYRARSSGMVVSNSILVFTGLLPMLFISKSFGAAELGQYSLVMGTVFLPSGLIGRAVGNVFYQRAAKLWNAKDILGFKAIWWETISKLMVFGIPVYFIIYWFSPWAYPFMFGEAWQQAGQFARTMAIAAFFSFLAGPLDRLSLILGMGFYLPLIHLLRFIVIIATVVIGLMAGVDAQEYLLFFSIGMSFMYLIDMVMCRFYFIDRRFKYE